MLNRADHIIPEIILKPKFRLVRHLLIQIAVLLISINVLWDEPVRILPERIYTFAAYFMLINMVTYTSMYVLVPRLLLKGKAKIYLIATVLLILFSVVYIAFIQGFNDNGNDNSLSRTPAFVGIASGFSAFSLFIAGITTLQLFNYHIKNREKISALKNVTMEIELANLQNQLNPHFLFNMLNNVNIMIGEDTKKSSHMLLKLHDLLHYQVDGSSKGEVNLKEEMGFLSDYLELEKMRRDRFSYSMQIEGDSSITLPPLLFMPFVENAVKHNPENDSYVNITFRVTEDELYFECLNPKRLSNSTKDEAGGIGLVNIKRRLELLFGENHCLKLDDTLDFFTVTMKLKI